MVLAAQVSLACCSPRRMCFGASMGWQAVQHYTVAAFERRNQAPLEIRHEGCSVHRSIKHEGCDHPPTTQPGHEGEPLPMSMGHVADQSHASRAATANSHHIG